MSRNTSIWLVLALIVLNLVAACDGRKDAPASTVEPPTATVEATLDEASPDDSAMGLVGLMEEIKQAGAEATLDGTVEQPFFSVTGQIVNVAGQDVQVFVYANEAGAESEAAMIAPDASYVGTSMATWTDSPHFFAHQDKILLYVGSDPEVLRVLEEVVGPAIAKRPNLDPVPPTLEDAPQATDDVSVGSNTDAAVLATFYEDLATAIVDVDYEAMGEVMGDSLMVGWWLGEGASYDRTEAVALLRESLLPSGSEPFFDLNDTHFPRLMGMDPLEMFGPNVNAVTAMYTRGWGESGSAEAILIVALGDEGLPYWYGLISGVEGFQPPIAQ